MHSRRRWRKSNRVARLESVLFVVPLRPEPFEEPFAVAVVVVIVVAAAAVIVVIVAAGLDQHL